MLFPRPVDQRGRQSNRKGFMWRHVDILYSVVDLYEGTLWWRVLNPCMKHCVINSRTLNLPRLLVHWEPRNWQLLLPWHPILSTNYSEEDQSWNPTHIGKGSQGARLAFSTVYQIYMHEGTSVDSPCTKHGASNSRTINLPPLLVHHWELKNPILPSHPNTRHTALLIFLSFFLLNFVLMKPRILQNRGSSVVVPCGNSRHQLLLLLPPPQFAVWATWRWSSSVALKCPQWQRNNKWWNLSTCNGLSCNFCNSNLNTLVLTVAIDWSSQEHYILLA